MRWKTIINTIINNIQNNMNIIRPGVYRPKNNLKSDKIEGLITVIGENDNIDNYFDCRNRVNPISEDDLSNNYVYFGPGIEPTKKDKLRKDKMIKNIGNLDDVVIPHTTQTKTDTPIIASPIITSNPSPTQQNNQHIISEINNQNFAIDKILTKSKIDKPQQQTIVVSTNYDLSKVMLLCETFDINFNSIINKVINFNNMKFVDATTHIDDTNKDSNNNVDIVNEFKLLHDKLDLIHNGSINDKVVIEEVDTNQSNNELISTIADIKQIRENLKLK